YVGIRFCLLIIPLAAADIYMTVWGKDELICPPGIDCRKQDLEAARILTVIFAAPAYICGTLLLLDTLRSVFEK
ncbi:MAG: hypothetical protein PHV59_08015, partial [Victivallales bacterium]|nr:hypothetical protein [Victivallales bacterium]